jgi:hypothetical protein
MPTYLERQQTRFDELTTLIEETLQRAVDEDRDVTDAEQTEITRAETDREIVQRSIDHAAALSERTSRVAEIIGKIRPVARAATSARDAADGGDAGYDITRELPSPGHYASMLHRATVKRDPAAIAQLERATAHQTTADNPGIIPRPIVGPVIDRMLQRRPFVASVGVLPAPAGSFDRPRITQQVAVDVQAAEKDLTASQALKAVKMPVSLATYAGHLNISRQDIRWSQPAILDLVYASFTKVYARRTDKAACADFLAAITQTVPVASLDVAGIDAALGAAGTQIGGTDDDMGEPDTLWVSRDVAVRLGGIRNTFGQKLYNIPIVGGTSGELDGLAVVVDGRFPAGTAVIGDSDLVEYWEDLEGFLSVDEPDVLGQLVGYAGYGALCVAEPAGFVKLTIPAPDTEPPQG